MSTIPTSKVPINAGVPVAYIVQACGKPSLKALLIQLETKIKETDNKPFVRGVPIGATITYTVGGVGWGNEKNATPVLWHLSTPGIGALVDGCCESLARVGAVASGQIVHAAVYKVLGSVERSQIEIELAPLYLACRPDAPKRIHKLLEWFIRLTEAAGRKPTKNGFYALLRTLKPDEGEPTSEETKENVKAMFESMVPKI